MRFFFSKKISNIFLLEIKFAHVNELNTIETAIRRKSSVHSCTEERNM
jgi:hypothetical protein